MLMATLVTRLDIQTIAKQTTDNATYNMCEVGNLISHKDAINNLASNKESGHQDKGQGDLAILKRGEDDIRMNANTTPLAPHRATVGKNK